ncbi:CAP domain-containing protein [Actinomadura oligospora]|uniref:CAP domain-containing protein n=1 Tax=Actinomadura oligospora TaxID=111804 RepID=UPI0004B55F43|nr:CAP domain-containing protein [Actinomadura oligospora]
MRPPRRASRSSRPRDPRAGDPHRDGPGRHASGGPTPGGPFPGDPGPGYGPGPGDGAFASSDPYRFGPPDGGAPDRFAPPAGPRPLEHERHRPTDAEAARAHGPGPGGDGRPMDATRAYVPEEGDRLAYSPTGRTEYSPAGPEGPGGPGGPGGRDFWASPPGGGPSRRRRTPLIIAGAAGAMALVVGAGVAVSQLTSDDGKREPTAAAGPDGAVGGQGGTQPDTTPSDTPSRTPSKTPSRTPKAKPSSKKPSSSRPSSSKPGGTSGSGSGSSPSKTGGGSGSGSGSGSGGSGGSGGGGGTTASETAVLKITNQQRAKAGCSPLRYDARLARAARLHSQDMAAHNYFSHDSRNGDSPWDRIERQGYTQPGAENIAKGYADAAAVMKGWMNSPGHRANILNCGLKALGVGRANGPSGPLWTQDFGWK